jgi:hypothetical protein
VLEGPEMGKRAVGDQPLTAFGAAANLVHPATSAEVSRILPEVVVARLLLSRKVRDAVPSYYGVSASCLHYNSTAQHLEQQQTWCTQLQVRRCLGFF